MNVVSLALPGVKLIEPWVFKDARGFFLETYQADRYAQAGIDAAFVQDNHSMSAKNTLRGLHAQIAKPQGKLLRCIQGEIYDVAVDIRKGSPHFGKWVGVLLNEENFHQLYVPPGFAHGFCVLSESAQVEYKVTDVYDPKGEITLLWNDPQVGVEWPVSDPLLSQKDQAGKSLKDLDAQLPSYRA